VSNSNTTKIDYIKSSSASEDINSSDSELEKYFEKVKSFEAEIQAANEEYIKSFEAQMARHQELLNALVSQSQKPPECNPLQSETESPHQDFDLGQSINNLLGA